MNITENQLRSNIKLGSGRVRRFVLPGGKSRITQITTYCPDIAGPGPTHLYLIENEALILVDTGIPTHLAKAFFFYWRHLSIPSEIENLPDDYSEQQLLDGLKLAGYSIRDIDLLLISHGHPDHFLMGGAILRRGKPFITAHFLDTPEICNPWGMLNHLISFRKQMTATGMPPPLSTNDSLIRNLNQESSTFQLKMDATIFRDGPLQINGLPIQGIHVKHLPGHSPGSIGLIVGSEGEKKVLLCGDTLLSPITPHPNDLLAYLRTLEELKRLDEIALVLPAHGKVLGNLKTRVLFLKKYHQNRLKFTYDACETPQTIWDIGTMPDYFDIPVDPLKFNPLAGREILVHVELLQMAKGLFCTHIRNGVYYYQNSGEAFDDVYGRIMDLVADRKVINIMRY